MNNSPFLKDEINGYDFFKSFYITDEGSLIKSETKQIDLEKLKTFLIQILQKKLEKSFEIDFNEELLLKGKSFPIGTTREWRGKKFRKVSKGKWLRMYTGEESKGEKIAISKTITKIKNAKSISELAQIINENRKRFEDSEGKTHEVVKRLLDIAKHHKQFGRGNIAKDRKKSEEKKEQAIKRKNLENAVKENPNEKIQSTENNITEDNILNILNSQKILDTPNRKGQKDFIELGYLMDKLNMRIPKFSKDNKRIIGYTVPKEKNEKFNKIINNLVMNEKIEIIGSSIKINDKNKKEIKIENNNQQKLESNIIGPGITKTDYKSKEFHKIFKTIPRGLYRFAAAVHNDNQKGNLMMTNGKSMVILKKTPEETKLLSDKKYIIPNDFKGDKEDIVMPPYDKVQFEENENTVKTKKSINDIEIKLKEIEKQHNEYKKKIKDQMFKEYWDKEKDHSEKGRKKVNKTVNSIVNDFFQTPKIFMNKNGNISSVINYNKIPKKFTDKEDLTINQESKNESILNSSLLLRDLETIKNLRGNVNNLNITPGDTKGRKAFKISTDNKDIDYYLMPMVNKYKDRYRY